MENKGTMSDNDDRRINAVDEALYRRQASEGLESIATEQEHIKNCNRWEQNYVSTIIENVAAARHSDSVGITPKQSRRSSLDDATSTMEPLKEPSSREDEEVTSWNETGKDYMVELSKLEEEHHHHHHHHHHHQVCRRRASETSTVSHLTNPSFHQSQGSSLNFVDEEIAMGAVVGEPENNPDLTRAQERRLDFLNVQFDTSMMEQEEAAAPLRANRRGSQGGNGSLSSQANASLILSDLAPPTARRGSMTQSRCASVTSGVSLLKESYTQFHEYEMRPGAFCESNRAFGERPAWAREPGRRGSFGTQSNGDSMSLEVMSLDPLMDDDDDGGHPESNHFNIVSNHSRFGSIASGMSLHASTLSGFSDPLGEVTLSTDEVSRAEDCQVDLETGSEFFVANSRNLSVTEIIASSKRNLDGSSSSIFSKRNIGLIVALGCIFLIVLVGGIIALLLRSSGEGGGGGGDDHGEDQCASFSRIKQPSITLQCACRGEITYISEKTRTSYGNLRSLIFEEMDAPTAELLNFPAPLEVGPSPRISCDQPEQTSMLQVASSQDSLDMMNRLLLTILFHRLDGPKWKNNAGWAVDDGSTICDWHGVTCNSKNVAVELDLSDNSISGTIPPFIGLISSLGEVTATQKSCVRTALF